MPPEVMLDDLLKDDKVAKAVLEKMTDEERKTFILERESFRENLIIQKYGEQGEINDPKIS